MKAQQHRRLASAGHSARLSAVLAAALLGTVAVTPATTLAATYDPATDPYSMANTTALTGASAWWNAGYTGKGVDVALIDTGVAPVAGLATTGKVVYGPDLSLESQNSSFRYIDTNGHGTFMAGLIAGKDSTLTAPYAKAPASAYRGMAPDARIVSLKVGVADGGVYASEVRPDWTVSDAHPGPVTATLDGAPFTAGTAVTAAGTHTLVVTSIDLAGNSATRSVSFQIQPILAAVTATVDSGSPRVLVVVNCAGKPASCADSQALVLKAALAIGGIPYDIALDGPTFLAKLRENRHNVRVVYRAGSSATNAYWELRELTFEGGGLVVVNDASPDSDPKLIDTLGAAMGGKITSVGTVTISAGDLGPARTLSVAGSGIAQTLKASTALAVGKSSKGTVATTNRYGKGRAVTLTLNPEANVNAAMKDLLIQAVRFAAGGAPVAGVPGAPQYVRIESVLTSPAGPLDFRLDAWTGAGLTPLSDTGQPVVPPRTWSFPLTTAKAEVRSFGVVSGQKGTYPVLAELTLLTGGPRLVAQGSVDVVVVGSIAELKQAAIAAAQAIPAGLNDAAKSAAIAHLNTVNPAPATKAACASSIDQALQAADDLKLIAGTAAVDARVKADQLLRALQALHATLP